jgi:hypothetical protein
VEFKAIAEIFFKSRILCRHKGPAFRTSRDNAVADAVWQAITSWVRSNKSRLQNSVHCLLPYRKKDQFKAYGVKMDIPNGDGTPLGCGSGAEHSSADSLARD